MKQHSLFLLITFILRSVSESGTGPLDSEAPDPVPDTPLRNGTGSGSMGSMYSGGCYLK